ncbi:MAG TPA: hypothetical protein VFI34_11040 [Candidatus Limnocylindrales bacterium]|nr:hypothetical protein [Candidatus Limnocylindrales bacterium]
MTGIDWALVITAVLRLGLVASVLGTFVSGFSIRYRIRAAGWPRWTVRLATVLTWALALTTTARLFLLPMPTGGVRTLYTLLFLASVPILLFWMFGLDWTVRAIDLRSTRRVRTFREIQSIHDGLSEVETADARARLDGFLADLDRYLEPATFEYIQLSRLRIITWLEGGPQVETRENRWAELGTMLEPEAWRIDRWSAWCRRIRSAVIAAAPWLGIGAGLALGSTAFAGGGLAFLTVPAAIVAGCLLTWRWSLTAAPLIGSAAMAVLVTALIDASRLSASRLAAEMLVGAVLGGWAVLEWRWARRRPNLTLVPSPDEPTALRPRAS